MTATNRPRRLSGVPAPAVKYPRRHGGLVLPRDRVGVKPHINACPVCGAPVTFVRGLLEGNDAVSLLIRAARPTGTTFRSIGLYAHPACVAPLVERAVKEEAP